MKRLPLAAVLSLPVLFAMLTIPAVAQEQSAEVVGPQLLARFSEEGSPRTLFLYSRARLKSVHVWLNRDWVKAEEVDYPHEGRHYHVYRVSGRLTPAAGQQILANSWSAEGDRTYRHTLQVERSEGGYTVSAELQQTRSQGEYLADKEEYQEQQEEARRRLLASDRFGFIPLLNRYRQRFGLRPIRHDVRLSRDAKVNNSMGAPHAFMGGAAVQNWAAGFASASDVLRVWQNSPGHNRNLLNPNLTWGGISRDGGEWTFNGR